MEADSNHTNSNNDDNWNDTMKNSHRANDANDFNDASGTSDNGIDTIGTSDDNNSYTRGRKNSDRVSQANNANDFDDTIGTSDNGIIIVTNDNEVNDDNNIYTYNDVTIDYEDITSIKEYSDDMDSTEHSDAKSSYDIYGRHNWTARSTSSLESRSPTSTTASALPPSRKEEKEGIVCTSGTIEQNVVVKVFFNIFLDILKKKIISIFPVFKIPPYIAVLLPIAYFTFSHLSQYAADFNVSIAGGRLGIKWQPAEVGYSYMQSLSFITSLIRSKDRPEEGTTVLEHTKDNEFPELFSGYDGDSSPNIYSSCLTNETSAKVIAAKLVAVENEKNMQRFKNKYFSKRLFKIGSDIVVAKGYGLSNAMIICTQEGLVVIDTLDSPDSIVHVMSDFQIQVDQQKMSYARGQQGLLEACFDVPVNPHTRRPRVKTIIYSHFHPDHLMGAVEIYEPNFTEVYSNKLTSKRMAEVISHIAGTTYKRGFRQFGSLLLFKAPSDYIHAGLGPELNVGSFLSPKAALNIPPTHVWSGTNHTLILPSGEPLIMISAPGESDDQTIIWLPQRRILYGADNIYRAFPNIYPLRGESPRDSLKWVDSLEKMRSLNADVLVLGHSEPLNGQKEIFDTLTVYRDAIQFVHDQTLRYINKGYMMEEIGELVKLPKSMKAHEFLKEVYGAVAWSVKGIYTQYLGWFSGSPEQLRPLNALQKAKRIASLAGGIPQLLAAASKALTSADYQWALELTSFAKELDPDSVQVKQLRYTALRNLGAMEYTASGRNWYFTNSLETRPKTEDAKKELDDFLTVSKNQKRAALYSVGSIEQTLDLFSTRWRAEDAGEIDLVVSFRFTDTGTHACMHFRHEVAFSRPQCQRRPDIYVRVQSDTWIKLLVDDISVMKALATGNLSLWPPWPSVVTSFFVAIRTVDFD